MRSCGQLRVQRPRYRLPPRLQPPSPSVPRRREPTPIISRRPRLTPEQTRWISRVWEVLEYHLCWPENSPEYLCPVDRDSPLRQLVTPSIIDYLWWGAVQEHHREQTLLWLVGCLTGRWDLVRLGLAGGVRPDWIAAGVVVAISKGHRDLVRTIIYAHSDNQLVIRWALEVAVSRGEEELVTCLVRHRYWDRTPYPTAFLERVGQAEEGPLWELLWSADDGARVDLNWHQACADYSRWWSMMNVPAGWRRALQMFGDVTKELSWTTLERLFYQGVSDVALEITLETYAWLQPLAEVHWRRRRLKSARSVV